MTNKDREHYALLQKVIQKNSMAFEELYHQFHPQLTRFLKKLLKRPELVEELVNDTLFTVWQKAVDFQNRSKVSTWIVGIAYLKGIKALDRLKMIPDQQAVQIGEIDEWEDPKDIINTIGLREWLQTGLQRIPSKQRQVVELSYFVGCSYLEISEIVGCPVNTAKTRVFHARRKLEKILPTLE